MNQKLKDAVAIFKELGWENVTMENVLILPTGTPEQKQMALAGLRSGDWGEFAEIKKNTYGYRSYTGVDEGKLALFAVRIGADAQRAANILRGINNDEIFVAVIAERGVKYALDFITHACVSRRRIHEHSVSVYGNTAVRLVDKLNLNIPQNVEYMKDWSVYAAAALGLKADIRYQETDLPGAELIERRFAEHIEAGVALNTPATGPFGAVLPAGVKRGWLFREKAVSLVFSALDASVRPGDRKVWINVLDELGISDEELCARTQALIPLMASGDSAVIERIAPVLIAGADEILLSEVLIAAFSATAKKTKQLVLKCATGRPRPKNLEHLEPWLSILAGDKDKAVASLAAKLAEQWGAAAEILPEEKAEIQGLWQETPPVWKVPPFELGKVTPEALTELAAELVKKPEIAHDVTAERFLAMANSVAYKNPEAARTSLRGLRRGGRLLDFIVYWVKNEKPQWGFDKDGKRGTTEPLVARDLIVTINLGKQPCLLSTPGKIDLSISVSDLVSRLMLYKEAGVNVLEADLFLALTRLDVSTKTKEAAAALEKMDVTVVLQSEKKMSVTAGQAVLTYINKPLKEPPTKDGDRYSSMIEISTSESLPGFPNRFDSYQSEHYSTYPLWGDVSLHAVAWNDEVYHEKGLILRQVARRAAPLPPGASINFLAAQRSSTPAAAEDSLLAVKEAWERGLLRPGTADVSLLDWSSQPPSNLAAFAAALDGIARDGMLSLVWPILDDLILASLKAPRLLAGTAELAELIETFLPEAQFAVKKGLTDKSTLNLPGIRELAQRGGSSRAVSTAQKIVGLLPPAEAVLEEKPVLVIEKPFEEIWTARKKKAVLIDDGVRITVDWANPESPKKLFLFTLTLPGISDRVFQIVKDGEWCYDLEIEGQCEAYSVTSGTTVFEHDREKRIWLYWDMDQKAMAVCDHRNRSDKNNGPLNRQSVRTPPLPFSLLTVSIGMLAQGDASIYSLSRFLTLFIENGQIDENIIREATRTLLKYPVVSPAKLVRMLEKDICLLPVLWPMLTECVKAAGALTAAGEKPPVWVNRILDIAIRYAPYLKEAAKRGLIPAKDAEWAGLSEIASSKEKSTAIAKAKKLLILLGCQNNGG